MTTHTNAGDETVQLDPWTRTKLDELAGREGVEPAEIIRRAIARELARDADEEWRPIPGYEGRYDVSDQGRVRSWLRPGGGKRFASKPRMLRGAINPNGGYRFVGIRRAGGKMRNIKVGTLVMLAFVGNRPEGKIIRHLNDEPLDNRLVNLKYGTNLENSDDMRFFGSLANSLKTHCKRGHEFTPQTTGRGLTGTGSVTRICRTCAREREASRRAAAKAAA